MRSAVVIALLASVAALAGHAQGQDPASRAPLTFDCDAFPPTLSIDDLVTRFGADNVFTSSIFLGEGHTEGTVVMPETDAALEVVWADREAQRGPARVTARRGATRWRTPDGLSVGTDLLTIEKLNRRPFRLRGFGWDYSGTVANWSGGRLEREWPCERWLRLVPDPWESADQSLVRQVLGEREYSSGHPAMQALNPRVYEVSIRNGRFDEMLPTDLAQVRIVVPGFLAADEPVQLIDGLFRVEGEGGRGVVRIERYVSFDADDDGGRDYALLLSGWSPGTGSFRYLSVALRGPDGMATTPALFLEDRIRIRRFYADRAGNILIAVTEHAETDPSCCPTRDVLRTYRVLDGVVTATSVQGRDLAPAAPRSVFRETLPTDGGRAR